MPQQPAAVHGPLHEPERHLVQPGVGGEVPPLHQRDRPGLEQARPAEPAALQVGDHEARHVGGGDAGGARGIGADVLVAAAHEAAVAPAVARGQVGGEPGGHRLAEGGAPHAERAEDVGRHVLVERLAGHALHDVAGQRRAVIGVAGDPAGREDPCRQAADQVVAQPRNALRVLEEQVRLHGLEAGGVREQVAHGDRLAEGGGDPEIQVPVEVRVEVDPALLDELHHRRPGDRLGGGAGARQGALGVEGKAALEVGVPVAPGEDRLAALHDGDRGAGDPQLFELARQEAVEEGVQPGEPAGPGGGGRPGGRWSAEGQQEGEEGGEERARGPREAAAAKGGGGGVSHPRLLPARPGRRRPARRPARGPPARTRPASRAGRGRRRRR